MINSFDTDVASEVGIIAAILYHNIQYWCEKNRTNEIHNHDGYYWCYNSTKAFCAQFPYLSRDQINYALKKLEDAKYIITGNYNKSSYDRTKWYADIRANVDGKSITSISYQSEMDCRDSQNEFGNNPKPIPNINTNNNQITNIKENVKKKFDAIAYLDTIPGMVKDPEIKDVFVKFIEMRESIKHPIPTEYGLKQLIKQAWELGDYQKAKIIAVVNQSITSGYRGLFALKEDNSRAIAPKASGSSGTNESALDFFNRIEAEEMAKEAAT